MSNRNPAHRFQCGRFLFTFERPLVMGILNVTPDSFSDGGRFLSPAAARAWAERMVELGVDIIDVGAESTRPGSDPVSEDEEWRRLEPVLAGLMDIGRAISVDTRRLGVMKRALELGIDLVNDVSGFRDPQAIEAVAGSRAAVCIMHMLGDEPRTMQKSPHYDDVVKDVRSFLVDRARALQDAGIAADRISIDPGFGFGKTLEHNVTLLARLEELAIAPHPLLVGLSRKSMIGQLTGKPVGDRLAGSLTVALESARRGAQIIRVHDVAETVDALKVQAAIRAADALAHRAQTGA